MLGATLIAVLVGFPLVKIHVLDQLSSVRRFTHTGWRPGWYGLWFRYVGIEIVLAVACWFVAVQAGFAPGLVGPARRRWGWALVGAVTLVVVLVVVRAAGIIENGRHPAGADYLVTSTATNGQRVLLLALSCVGVVCEELMFRGFAISALERLGWSRRLALIVPAASFGYLHGGVSTIAGLSQTIAVAIAAVGLGALYQRNRSLLPTVVLHLLWVGPFIALTPR